MVVLPLLLISAASASSIHTVFTTECSSYFTWQSLGEEKKPYSNMKCTWWPVTPWTPSIAVSASSIISLYTLLWHSIFGIAGQGIRQRLMQADIAVQDSC